MAAPEKPLFIDTRRELAALSERLKGQDILALDTEFIREKSYVPKLEIVQVATRDGLLAVIDYATIGRMDDDPFMAIINDPGVLKIFHAAEQDLEMFHLLSGVVPSPMWDTQLVTGLFGYTGRLGYAAVAENMLGAKPAKGETLTDWSQRPLTPEQLHYAIEDVRYLIPLYDIERKKLEDLGRLTWAEEECERDRRSVEETLACRADMTTLYQRVRGWHNLDRRGLAVLRELAMWREDEAMRRNRPRGSVLKDEMLVEIARRAPNHPGQLRALRGLQPRDIDRHGEDMVAAVKAGKAVPTTECPIPGQPGPILGDEEMALASLLQAVLQAISSEKLVSNTLVATFGELQRLVEAHVHGRTEDSPVVTGWRGELVGKDLMGILEGRRAVVWDPAKKALRIEER
jgi:ribonuclease D